MTLRLLAAAVLTFLVIAGLGLMTLVLYAQIGPKAMGVLAAFVLAVFTAWALRPYLKPRLPIPLLRLFTWHKRRRPPYCVRLADLTEISSEEEDAVADLEKEFQ